MKPFTLPETTFKGHSRSMSIASFMRLPGLSIRGRKSKLHLFSDKNG